VTEEEYKLVVLLGDAWNAFCDLPEEHPMEREEFCAKIHDLQRAVMARTGRRWLKLREAQDGT
jgi:hypothetical protein